MGVGTYLAARKPSGIVGQHRLRLGGTSLWWLL